MLCLTTLQLDNYNLYLFFQLRAKELYRHLGSGIIASVYAVDESVLGYQPYRVTINSH